jgi:hypothetical protein
MAEAVFDDDFLFRVRRDAVGLSGPEADEYFGGVLRGICAAAARVEADAVAVCERRGARESISQDDWTGRDENEDDCDVAQGDLLMDDLNVCRRAALEVAGMCAGAVRAGSGAGLVALLRESFLPEAAARLEAALSDSAAE